MENQTIENQSIKNQQFIPRDSGTGTEENELKKELVKKKPRRGTPFGTLDSENMKSEAVSEEKNATIKITFEGEVANRILKCEAELRERLSKPDLGKLIGKEILSWSEKRWTEIVEENTDVEYFFAQIRKYGDRGKSIKMLKSLAEKLKSENDEAATSPIDSNITDT